jgi:hypothetical protein
MSNPNLKEYLFSNVRTVVEETLVKAKSYDEAEDIYLSGGGETDEVDSFGSDWECIDNPDECDEVEYD